MLISHAFNPLLILMLINLENTHDKKYAIKTPLNIVSHVSSAFMVYMLWLGLHAIVLWVVSGDFDFDRFIGVNQGLHYFVPFFIGVFVMLHTSVIKPALKSENVKQVHFSFIVLISLIGIYFMLINYLVWLAG